jgi:hypothetical protein
MACSRMPKCRVRPYGPPAHSRTWARVSHARAMANGRCGFSPRPARFGDHVVNETLYPLCGLLLVSGLLLVAAGGHDRSEDRRVPTPCDLPEVSHGRVAIIADLCTVVRTGRCPSGHRHRVGCGAGPFTRSTRSPRRTASSAGCDECRCLRRCGRLPFVHGDRRVGRRCPGHDRILAGIDPDRRPSEAMIRRLLQALDPDLLTAAIGDWLSTRAATALSTAKRAIAVDGKTLRGSRTADTTARHVMAARDQDTGIVLASTDVDARPTNHPLGPAARPDRRPARRPRHR